MRTTMIAFTVQLENPGRSPHVKVLNFIISAKNLPPAPHKEGHIYRLQGLGPDILGNILPIRESETQLSRA